MTTMPNGTYIRYRDINLRPQALEMIDAANKILDEYGRQGLDMTLRQLHYQFVARGLYPNTDKSYDELQRTINNGRLAGLVSWDAIQDRGRTLRGTGAFDSSPAMALEAAADGYIKDLWANQPMRPIVVVEKEAQLGNISRVCNDLRVQYFASKGYNSQSEQWRMGQMCASYIRRGQRPVFFDLRDHDPSGVHMTQDHRERMAMFVGMPVMVQRLALNMDQVIAVNPPPNPAKLATDSRGAEYVSYMTDLGYEHLSKVSWELDALSPSYIKELVESAVLAIRDPHLWEQAVDQEQSEREYLELLVEDARGSASGS